MDWLDPLAGDPVKEREEDTSSLAVGFAARTCKRATNAQGETIPGSEVFGEKHLKRSS